jgi:hypothetical protein
VFLFTFVKTIDHDAYLKTGSRDDTLQRLNERLGCLAHATGLHAICPFVRKRDLGQGAALLE